MAENKTKRTGGSVKDYVASRADERQRADCRQLMAMLKKVTGQRPYMYGPSIVGYGSYNYTYESGRAGKAPLAGFAIGGRELVVYVAEGQKTNSLRAKLGKHSMGKTCLYVKQLADVDTKVLEKIVTSSVAEMKRKYPA